MNYDYSEDDLIEQPAVQLFYDLKWDVADCFSGFDSGKSTLGRETPSDVILVSKLKPALQDLNNLR